MENQGYLFHALKGKFPLLSRKARDGECHSFFSFFFPLNIYQWCCCTLKTSYAFYSSLLSCHNPPNNTSALCQFEGSSSSHNSSGSDGSQSPVPLLSLDTAHPSWSKNNHLKLPTCSRATLSNTILQGVTPPCHSDFLDVDTVLWVNICCCYSTVVSFRLCRSKDENMFWCLPAACSTWEASAFPLGCWAAVPKDTSCPPLSETSVSFPAPWSLNPYHQQHSSGFLAVHVAIFPSFHIKNPRKKGEITSFALQCMEMVKKQTN